MNDAELVELAIAARRNAIATYSQFQVGAALECADGTMVSGCNIENASYGLTMCAERVALFKALSEGHRHFKRICVATAASKPTPPCGSCRQLLWEFCGDIEILIADLSGVQERYSLREIFPKAFDTGNLAS